MTMHALTTIRWQGKKWHICPWASLRAAAVSLVVVISVAVILDRVVLAQLERQGLVASEGWSRHNRIVVENHQRKDRHFDFHGPKRGSSSGVRAWLGHEVTKGKPLQHRILVMGDSFVWGASYLTLNHMWWRQLAIELQRRGYADVEVIAAGHSGLSTHDELDLAKQVIPEFQPDLILWGFVTNDPDEKLVKQISNTSLSLPMPHRIQILFQRCLPRLFELIKARRADKLAKVYLGPEYGYEYSDWLRRIHEGKNFELYRQTISELSAFLKQVHIPGMMVTLPEAPIIDRFAFSYEKILPLWRDAGIPVQDNLAAFARRFPDAEKTGPRSLAWGINPADGHPGPHSTAVLAQLTADRLEQDYPQILGPKSTPSQELRINDWLPYDLDVQPLGDGTVQLIYPKTDELMPTMPLEIPTALIALEQPQPLGEVSVRGAGLKSARVWISTYDPVEFYDTQDWKDLGTATGKDLKWVIPAELSGRNVSVIQFKAEFESGDRKLELQLRRTTQ